MFSEKEINEKFTAEYSKLEKEIKKPNILIVGGTGVGKSSLINKIFGEKVAKISDVKPQTRGIKTFTHKDVVLLDTEGFELGQEKDNHFEENIIGEIAKRKLGAEKDQIHLIWHLVAASSERVTDYDVKLFKKLNDFGLPVAVTFTKSDLADAKNMDAMIKRLYPNLTFEKSFEDNENPPFFVSATEDDEKLSAVSLINWSISKLPEALKLAFISSQVLSYDAKHQQAKSIINQHTIANSAVGFTPIPFSDAPILIVSQIGMLTRIIKLYGLSEINIGNFMTTTGAGLVVSNLGKTIVGSLLKFIPGFGTVVGGAINAAVSGAITYSMGTALNVILRKLTINVLNGNSKNVDEVLSNFSSIFKAQFAEEFQTKNKK